MAPPKMAERLRGLAERVALLSSGLGVGVRRMGGPDRAGLSGWQGDRGFEQGRDGEASPSREGSEG